MLNKETINLLSEIENVAYRCVIDEYYFEIITSNTKNEFWTVVQNALGDGVCIYWTHLFSSYSDDLHYSKIFSRKDILEVGKEYSTEAVKNRILKSIDYDAQTYKEFREEVKNCRDKFIAHKEINSTGIYPRLNICRLMAEELRTILSELVEKCNPELSDGELFWLHKSYLCNQNKHLYKRCLTLYNSRGKDSLESC